MGTNRYSYSLNDPVNLSDPNGNAAVFNDIDGDGWNEYVGEIEPDDPAYHSDDADDWMAAIVGNGTFTAFTGRPHYDFSNGYSIAYKQISGGGLKKFHSVLQRCIQTKPCGNIAKPIVRAGDQFFKNWLPRQFNRLSEGVTDIQVKILRRGYEKQVGGLKQIAEKMRQQGFSSEAIAREVSRRRREIGIAFKNRTPTDRRGQIYERNLIKYGDELGPTIKQLRAAGKSWEEIIESASRTVGKDLGL